MQHDKEIVLSWFLKILNPEFQMLAL